MPSDFFHVLMRWNVERHGATRLLPYFYYDNLSLAGVYTASTPAVRSLIPHADLLPIELRPGRCLVAFTAFEYRKTDEEPYNEISISFLVSHRRKPLPLIAVMRALGTRVVPSYVWQLPVTTEGAGAGGADLYGYPKFLADICISKDAERVCCVLSVSGEEILRLDGRVLPTQPGKPIRYITYAVDGDSLVSANIVVNRLENAESRARDSVRLGIGEAHPICAALRELELAKHPMIYQYSPRNEAILFPACNVMDV
jgi:hypothetical protein